MWRPNAFPGNSDSDQSISDEDDLNGDLGNNCISLNTNIEKEQGLLLQSRLEILRGKGDVRFGRELDILTNENQTTCFDQDEVEIPDSPNEDDYALAKSSNTSSARKLHKDNNLDSSRSEKRDGACTSSTVSKEAEVLTDLYGKSLASCSAFSNSRKSCKGVRGKVKPKFSLCLKLHKDELSENCIPKNKHVMPSKARAVLEQLESAGDGAVGNSNLNFPEEFHRETENQLKNFPYEIEAHANELIEPSMAERLDGLQDRNVPPRGSSEMSRRMRGKSTQYFLKKSISSVGDRIIDNQEQPEGVITESSSDDEVNYQNLNLANQEMKGQTMADRFQEALAATSFSNEGALFMAVKLSGIGLFGKLQKVMQNEKERDADFLKKLQMGDVPNDESQSIVVKILSRYLEAKLIVCHCSFHKNLEDSQLPEGALTVLDRGRKGTVIFSPRVCSDVELEIGNLIRIHPPWKEVQVMGNNEGIILSTYFSHIFM